MRVNVLRIQHFGSVKEKCSGDGCGVMLQKNMNIQGLERWLIG